MKGFGIPQLDGDDDAGSSAGEPERAAGLVVGDVQGQEQIECSGQRRRGGGVSIGHPHREPVEQDVDRTRRFGAGGRCTRSLGRLQQSARDFQIAGHRGPERLEVRLARQSGVERLEVSGRAHEQPAGVAAAALLKSDLPAQALHLGGSQGVERAGLDRDQQAECRVERAGVALRLAAASSRCARRPGSGVSIAARSRNAAAAANPPRACARPAERSSSSATSSSGPGVACARCHARRSGSTSCIGDVGKGAVHVLPLLKRRRLVGRRAHQRMTEPHARVELDQPGLDCGCRSVSPDREPLGRSPNQRGVADRVRGRDLQQAPCLGRKPVEPPPEALLDPARQRHRAGEPEPARELSGRHPPRQLQQGQRVAACLGDDLVTDPRIQRPGEHRLQQRARIGLLKTLDQELRQSRQIIARRACREDQADGLRLQPPCNECQDLRRGAIEPLLVIHQADHRLLLSRLGQQAQDSQGNEEAIRRRPGTDAERGLQRIALRIRKPVDVIKDRRQQLMQPSEGQLHLRLDTGGTQHAEAGRLLDQVLEQRGLAHARFASDNQRPALTRANGGDESVELIALAAPAL